MRCVWAAGLLACLWLGVAHADPVDLDAALNDCMHGADPDATITACTAAMNRKDITPQGKGILYEARGAASYQKSDFGSAVADYTEAVNLNPKSAAAYGGRGIANYSAAEYAQAIYDLTKALELDPNHPFARSIRGICYVDIGQNKEAVDDLTKVISSPGGGSPMDLYYRGAAYANGGDNAKAKADFKACLAKVPDQKQCKEGLGQLK